MSQAPRFGSRVFPDADQLGIATGVVVNQSRVTFSGGRGQVLVRWSIRMQNAGVDQIVTAALNAVGTAPLVVLQSDRFTIAADANDTVQVTEEVLVTDPPDGSFVEAETLLDAAKTVDTFANSCILRTTSYAPGVDQGPVVTVS